MSVLFVLPLWLACLRIHIEPVTAIKQSKSYLNYITVLYTMFMINLKILLQWYLVYSIHDLKFMVSLQWHCPVAQFSATSYGQKSNNSTSKYNFNNHLGILPSDYLSKQKIVNQPIYSTADHALIQAHSN